MASSVGSCSARDAARNRITIIELGHNSCNYDHREKQVDIAMYDRMLTDPGQVDCPLLERLGYPVILMHSRPGTKCIPEVQVLAVSNNPRNNRAATVAASRVGTGLAMGCVVGEVYALRKDTKSLTVPEWEVLSEMLDQLMDEYGEGPGHVTGALLTRYKHDTRDTMRARGLREPGAGSGNHCLECGEEEGEDAHLLRCAGCKMAYYCSKACQKAHWRGGHKDACRPREENSEASQVQRLMESAVLRPEQVIARRVTPPPLPRGLAEADPQLAALSRVMPPEVHRLFVYNRATADRERICPQCRTKYRLLENPAGGDRAAIEQSLSGLCSFGCFRAFHPEGMGSGPEWYGQEAVQLEGMHFKM